MSVTEQAEQPHNLWRKSFARRRPWLGALLLLVLCAGLYGWRLGVVPFDDFDEAYYAAGAQEMMARGDFGTPYYNGQPFLLKPILIYWLIAASFHFFGTNEFAARLVSVAGATFLVLLTYWFGLRTLRLRAAFLAALALALCYMWIDTGREAMIDMPLTSALASALLLFYLATQPEAKRKSRLYLAAYPLLGLALLAKGPVATGVALCGFLAYLAAARKLRATLREARLLPGLALMLAVAAPWYVYESLHQPEFVRIFLIREHFGHIHGHLARNDAWWGHLKNLFAGFYPWAVLLPAAYVHAFRQTNRQHVLRFAAWWSLAVIAAFSLAGAKLPHYLVPAFPALALLIGGWFDDWLDHRTTERGWTDLGFAALALCGLIFAAAAAVGFIMPPALREALNSRFAGWSPGIAPLIMLAALGSAALAAVLAAVMGRRRAVFPLLAAGMLIAAVAHIGWFKPRLKELHDHPRKELAVFAGKILPVSEPFGVYYAKRNAPIFYARRPIVDLGEWKTEKLITFLKSPHPAAALTHEKFLPELRAHLPHVYIWKRSGNYVLVANHPLPEYEPAT